MNGLLADVNCEGQVGALVRVFESSTWKDVWSQLQLAVYGFEQVSLDRRAPDRLAWQVCQERGLLLITRNRNRKGEDSLEAVIRELNRPESLPVITLANADRITRDRVDAEAVAEELMDYLLYIENFLGTGRLWVPRGSVP